MPKPRRTKYCGKKRMFRTELDAKIVLAFRLANDKGEIRAYRCGNHFHLTSQPQKTEPRSK